MIWWSHSIGRPSVRPTQSSTSPLHTNQSTTTRHDTNTSPQTPTRRSARMLTCTFSCGARLGSINSSSPRRGRAAAAAAMGAPDAARARAVDRAIRPKEVASVAIYFFGGCLVCLTPVMMLCWCCYCVRSGRRYRLEMAAAPLLAPVCEIDAWRSLTRRFESAAKSDGSRCVCQPC